MRRLRRCLYFVLILLLLIGALLIGVRSYLASARGAAGVAARLESVIGAPVRLAGVYVGLETSSLKGMQIFEAGPNSPDQPWAVIDEVQADVAAWSLIRGDTSPQRLTLVRAAVLLRFNADGHLLTELPRPQGGSSTLSSIRIEQSQVTLRQQGKPDLVVSDVQGGLQAAGDSFALSGTAVDPQGNTWDLGGLLDRTSLATTLTMKSPVIHLTQPILDDLPFIPGNVWDQVQAEGDTPVDLTLHFDQPGPSVRYKVALEPRSTSLHVKSIDLHAQQVQGKVIIEDGVVLLRDVRGQTAEGVLETSGELNFRAAPTRLGFSVSADRLSLHHLPQSWSVPVFFGGRLSGHAELIVTILNGKGHTSGEGEGTVHDARIAGMPARPVHLLLTADGERFQFKPQKAAPRGRTDVRNPAASGLAGDSPGRKREETALALMIATLLVTGDVEPAPPEPSFPGWLVRQVHDTVIKAGRKLLAAGTSLFAGAVNATQRVVSLFREPPTYLEASFGLDDVDLEQLVRNLNVQPPFPMAGRITFQAQVGIPLDTVRDPRTFRVDGTASLRWARIAELPLEQVRTQFVYRDGVLTLAEVHGQVAGVPSTAGGPPLPGTFEGSARLELLPQGDLSTSLKLQQIPLSRTVRLLSEKADAVTGTFSANLTARAPAARLRHPDAWDLTADLSCFDAEAEEAALTNGKAQITARNGVLSLKRFRGDINGSLLTGEASLSMTTAPYLYVASFQLTPGDQPTTQNFGGQTVSGRLAAGAEVTGTLSPLVISGYGTGAIGDFHLGSWDLGSARFRWDADTDRLRLWQLRIAAAEGKLTGEAVLPLRASQPGSIDLRFRELDGRAVAEGLARMGSRVAGSLSGGLKITIPAASPNGRGDVTVQADLESPRLLVQGFPIERLQGMVGYVAGKADYRFTGDTLRGRFVLEGKYPEDGRLRLESISLARLSENLFRQREPLPIQGSLDLEVSFVHEGPDCKPVGSGRFVLSRLGWNDTELSDLIQGDLSFSGQQVQVKELSGALGQGVLYGHVNYDFDQPERSAFRFSLEQAEPSRLLAPWPALGGLIDGPLSIQFRGTPGREWHGSASIGLARGSVLGVEANDARVPIDFAFSPATGRGQLEVREAHAHVALGQVVGQASYSWGDEARLEGKARFFGVELRQLLRSVSDNTPSSNGDLSGRIDFGGVNLRSLDDLSADLEATLQHGQILQLPVFRDLAPYIAPGQSLATVFRTGDCRARLARGVVRIERLRLVGPVVQAMFEGTVTTQGRLLLEVTANPGILPQTIGLITRRLIHLHVTGTVRNLNVQIVPLPVLTEDAVRLLLGQ